MQQQQGFRQACDCSHAPTQGVAAFCLLQMFYDDLPVWGFIGKVEKIVQQKTFKYYLFTHFHFDLSYNEDRQACMHAARAQSCMPPGAQRLPLPADRLRMEKRGEA